MIRPHRIRHEGTIEAAAFLIDDSLLGKTGARRRVLELWTRGALVHATARGYLVRFATRALCETTRAPGLPLVEARFRDVAVLTSAPLDDRELEALAPRAGEVVVVHGGVLERLVVPTIAEDVSAWIDLEGWTTCPVTSLGEPPPAPRTIPTEASVREILGGAVPRELPAEAALVAGAIQRAGSDPLAGVAGGAAFTGIIAALSSLFDRVRKTGGAGRGASSWTRVLDRMSGWLARQLYRARLGRWLARQQATYLSELLDSFDRGDIEAALKRAIPLGNGQGETRPALGVPKPRTELQLSYAATTRTTSMGLGNDLFAELRRRYRAAFERLEREGRIEEAAFVLAELLDAPEEAVAFLERHRRLKQAAALAEGRGLAPGLVIRQWFVAGDRARAIRIATARGGHADAIARLERSNKPELAAALRLAWADRLAASGDYAGAVEASWTLDNARSLASAWIDLAIEQGGATGARMLAKKIGAGLPDASDAAARARELLGAAGTEGVRERFAFAKALSTQSDQSGTYVEPIARATIRSLYADSAQGNEHEIDAVTSNLRRVASDSALSADRPRSEARVDRRKRFRHVFPPTDRGGKPVFDAALLPRGRVLVALGEAGVAVLGRDGKRVAEFDQPASALVVSDFADRAIALMPRGEAQRIARIDVAGRRSEPWCEAELDGYARTFDGSTWMVVTRAPPWHSCSDLLMIDALDEGLTALHQYPSIGDGAESIARSKARCEVISRPPLEAPVGLSFELPAWTLRGRAELQVHGTNGTFWACSPTGVYAALAAVCDDDGASRPSFTGDRIELVLRGECKTVDPILVGGAGETARSVEVQDGWVIATIASESALRIVVVDWRNADVHGVIVLEGAEHASARLAGSTVVLCDGLGRVIAVDLISGDITRDVRVW